MIDVYDFGGQKARTAGTHEAPDEIGIRFPQSRGKAACVALSAFFEACKVMRSLSNGDQPQFTKPLRSEDRRVLIEAFRLVVEVLENPGPGFLPRESAEPSQTVPERGFLEEGFARIAEAHVLRAKSGRRIQRGSVYCARRREGGPIKIGFSTDVGARMRSLNGGGPHPIELLAHCRTFDFIEKDIHEQLGESRVHCEWFAPTKEVLRVVSDLPKVCADLERRRPEDCDPESPENQEAAE